MGPTSKNNSPSFLVSVIVPMYKVEQYIAKCVHSIGAQSYDNLEIILIDDGSPDNSGRIADQLALEDHRIKVFHTENQGVSEARNLGIEKSNGDFLVFIDGDDFLSPDFIEYMCMLVAETGAEFVLSTRCFSYPNTRADGQIDSVKIKVTEPSEAASELLYPGRIEIGCWNKMFSREMLIKNKIRFPKDFFMGEGLNFIVNAALHSNSVAFGNRRVYYYRRDNQQSATTNLSAEKYINALSALDKIEKTIVLESELLNRSLRLHRVMTTYGLLRAIILTKQREQFCSEYRDRLAFLRHEGVYFLSSNIKVLYKILIFLSCLSPRLSVAIHQGLRKLRT